MTMDIYGHMIDLDLWDAAQRLGRSRGHGRMKDRTMTVASLQKITVD